MDREERVNELIIFFLFVPPVNRNGRCWEDGKRVSGTELSTVDADTPDECHESCVDDADCEQVLPVPLFLVH